MEEQERPSKTWDLSIVVPTYRREEVLVETITHLLRLHPAPREILVIDQSEDHIPSVADALKAWADSGEIQCIRLSEPSITRAMNVGLQAARAQIVLFVDDDIVPVPNLVEAHGVSHQVPEAAAVAGRVIQPWQQGLDFSKGTKFHFASMETTWPAEFFGGNFSIKRDIALAVGGFDENFVSVAYNFEAEFAFRLRSNGYRILFAPEACIHHRKIESGGTRSFGDHLRTIKPDHSVGAYYCILRTCGGWRKIKRLATRTIRTVMTRHHLRRPWWIPLTLIGELRGLVWALRLSQSGPRYLGRFTNTTRQAPNT